MGIRGRRAAGSVTLLAVAVLVGTTTTEPARATGPGPALTTGAASAGTDRPWLAAGLSPARRADLLLARMTLAEKVDLMTGNQGEAPFAFYNAPIPRLGIPALKMADAGGGVAPRGWTLPDTGGKATAMPAEIALGATWSTATTRRYAAVVADEVRRTGQNVLLGPDADIDRLPWAGRISESQGEDPLLNADLNTEYVRTVQSRNVIATLKHYTGNNQETNRNSGQNSVMDERTLREMYALVFESVVARAGLGAAMCSFNKINGEYSCQNAVTLRELLKGRIGFTGFVTSDFGALHDTLPGLAGGTDLETGTTTVYDGALLAALQAGTADLAQVDDAVRRILTTMFRLGLFDVPDTTSPLPVAEHDAVAREVEAKAITLLKNDGGLLPLTGSARRSIAVIGADATILAAESGSAYVDPTTGTPTLQGIVERAGPGARVTFTPGNDPVNAASMLESTGMSTVPSSVLEPAEGTGPGLTARFWHTPDPTGPPAVTRVERQVNYDVGFASTFPGWAGAGTQVPLPPVNFFLEQQAVSYDGFLVPPATGDHRLSLTGWGDATLTLDGRTVVDMTGTDGRRVVTSPPLRLQAGHRYRLHVDYRATRPLTGLQPGALLLQWQTLDGARSPDLERAVAAARTADVAVVYVRDFETEERDRVSLQLPQSADRLVRAVAAANPRTVVVLATGGPVTMPWIDRVPTVLQTYFGGQQQGRALADVLWGDVAPQGRLPLTYPKDERSIPPTLVNPWAGIGDPDLQYAEGVNVGYRGYLAAGIRPLFPFGYGLTYTRFRYSDLSVQTRSHGADTVEVRLRLTNTGRRTGTETVQLYLGLPAGLGAPPRRLAAHTQVTLRPGRSTEVRLMLRADDPSHPLGWFDAAAHRWRVSPGSYRVFVGGSVQDTPLIGSFRLGPPGS
jgi:beta-glucosidase